MLIIVKPAFYRHFLNFLIFKVSPDSIGVFAVQELFVSQQHDLVLVEWDGRYL